MVLRPLEPVILRHGVEERGVLEHEIVDLLHVGNVERVLQDDAPYLHQLAPAHPRRMQAHLSCEERLKKLDTAWGGHTACE